MSRSTSRTYFDSECSIFVGNLGQKVTEEILWELFLQAGPLKAVHIPKNKDTGQQRSFGFVEFHHDVSVQYACELMDSLLLFGRALKCKPQSGNRSLSQTDSPNSSQDELRNQSLESPGHSSFNDRGYHDSRERQRHSGSSPAHHSNSILGTPQLMSPQVASYQQTPTYYRTTSSPAHLSSSLQSPYLLHALQQQQFGGYRDDDNRVNSVGPIRRTPSYSQHRSPYSNRSPRR